MTRSIRQPFTLALIALSLGACLVNRSKVTDDEGDSSIDSSTAGMDASHDSSTNGGEAGATTGAQGGNASTTGNSNNSTGDAQANGDAGKLECTTPCDTIEASKCDTSIGSCVRCSVGDDCTALDDTPACNRDKGCVECVFMEDTKKCKGKTPHCSNDLVLENKCVECNFASECGDDAPLCIDHKCVSCTKAPGEACDDRDNKICEPVSGACVQCTRANRSACGDDVCNADTYRCETGVKAGSAPLCGSIQPKTCVSNDECPAGSTCVQEFLGSETYAAWYCMPTKGSSLCKRPFAGEQTKPTRDDVPATVCSLRISTCSAHSQYSGTNCASDADSSKGDNSKCGRTGVDDGYCVDGGGVLGFVCTVACSSTVDCPDLTGPSDPTCASQAHETGTDSLCTL